jgi:hypothetical protein
MTKPTNKPKKPLKPRYDARGRRVLSLAGGRQVALPLGVDLFDPPASFLSTVLKLVAGAFGGFSRAPKMRHILILRDGSYVDMLSMARNNKVWWCIISEDRSTYLGGGMFRKEGRHLRETMSGVIPALRGKGLYSSVLKELRASQGLPLLSDKLLSIPNIVTWMNAGVAADDRGGFAVNPGRRIRRRPLDRRLARQLLASIAACE